MTTNIWWIRRDLRLADNQALAAALQSGNAVVPCFILDPFFPDSAYYGSRRMAFLLDCLRSLAADLETIGGRLIVRRGTPQVELPSLCQEISAEAVFAERDFSSYALERDRQVAHAMECCPLVLADGLAARPPGTVRKADGSPYTVFTPFAKAWRNLPAMTASDLIPKPTRLNTPGWIASHPLRSEPQPVKSSAFPAGEAEAMQRLRRFVSSEPLSIYDYAKVRNRPDLNGTSQLSPYLRFGMISARQAVVAATQSAQHAPNAEYRSSTDTWLNELIWRDFYIHILHDHPHVQTGSFRPEYDSILWANDLDEFEAWCEGRTGYPFVDAAMRQLKATGWMHNRARMVVASFLVKHLLIDWRWGERWFMQQLIDGDRAANNGGWQWSAGTGTDAAPYFRIFNPIAQGTKFDPAGTYVRSWVPELRHVAGQAIHTPWAMSADEQTAAGCRLGHDYPFPMVDHRWARQRTLDAYAAARDNIHPR